MLIAEDPTAGVDVGAKAEIYGLMARALDEGLAVLVVSTDFEEIAQICHRAIIFNRGRIVAELAGDALTTEAVIMAASASEGPEESDRMAINSFKSNALEPTRTELRQLPLSARLMRLLPIYGLVILTVLLALFFSLVLPATLSDHAQRPLDHH